jgi:hypothetical protein
LRWLSILVVALALVAAGCGGGDDESSAVDETTVEETTTEETTTEETTTETSEGDTDGAFAWASEDCQSLVQAYAGLSAAVGAASGGQDVSGDIEAFGDYVEKVPDEIREDVETLASAYGTFVDEMKDLGLEPGEIPSGDQIQALEEASKSIGSPEVQAASERLNTWTTENCSP